MKTARVLLGLGIALTAFAAAAQTPPTHYNLHEMNFDMWCQETKHYPPARCDQRLPADDAEFQAYVAKIQKYEVPYLEQRRQEQERDRSILHNDPVDSPPQPSAATPESAPQP